MPLAGANPICNLLDPNARTALRLQVATIVGWKKIVKESSTWNNVWELNGVRQDNPPPLYASDMNAIQEVEQVFIKDDMLPIWHANMVSVCGSVEASMDATAAQHAQAFVMTLAPANA
jgi:hypothetical protein